MTDFQEFHEECSKRIEVLLAEHLPKASVEPTLLHEAMRYSGLSGGKRIRPLLVYLCGEVLGTSEEALDVSATAIELIHTYSLIHDDLPAMDDDDLRRGRPSCHHAYDEATAILAGDALQSLAFSVLSSSDFCRQHPERTLEMIRVLAQASGSRGMAGGQSMDLEATGRQLTLTELEMLHIHKTGALISACALLPLHATGTHKGSLYKCLVHYAHCIGLAFQIQDDILDVTGDQQETGKSAGKDIAQNKSTYPALLGLQRAQESAEELITDACKSLSAVEADTSKLAHLAEMIITRRS